MADHPALETRTKPPEVFISYASRDLDRAAALHARLVAAGFSVWFDRARLNPDCDWHKEIEAGWEAARVVLTLLSPDWWGSPWTKFETYTSNAVITKYETYTSDAVIPLLGGRRERERLPPLRGWENQVQVLDPTRARDSAWETLFAAIRAKLAQPAPERTSRVGGLPHPANPFFMGRGAELVRIREELDRAPVVALTQGDILTRAPMRGVGATTLANEYARRFWRVYPQILWVDAPGESLEKFKPGLAGWHGDSLGPTQPLCGAP
jgi:hypothetical protein